MLTASNFSVIILCPELNSGGLRYTSNTIRGNFGNINHVGVIGSNANDTDIEHLSKFCRVVKGGRTVTSLINRGMKEMDSEWFMIVMSGANVRYKLFKKYCYFSEHKAILYPVINKKYIFDEASINGIFMEKSSYKDIGSFSDDFEDIKVAKLLWANNAIEKKYKLKGIVNARW